MRVESAGGDIDSLLYNIKYSVDDDWTLLGIYIIINDSRKQDYLYKSNNVQSSTKQPP